MDPVAQAAARRRKPRRRLSKKGKAKSTPKRKAKRKTAQRCTAPKRGRARASDSLYAVDAKRKRRKVKRVACAKKRKPLKRRPVQPVPPPPAPPVPPPAAFQLPSPLATYGGGFGVRQAERLLWRAGFGPSPGHAEFMAGLGLHKAVAALTRPDGGETFTGAEATDEGDPLAPEDAWGHDHLWFLDRMVRTNQPLMQRMTLIWHDWFATSNDGVGQQNLMLAQNMLFRWHALGSFDQLVHDVTRDSAMLLWLNGVENRRNRPNENYARELMELFTLGADRGAYTENDVRELARALTGWRNDWSSELGSHNFRFYAPWFDNTNKTVFGQTGNFNWEQAAAMCVRHPLHPSFFVNKLWSYFIPTPPSDAERAALELTYVGSGYQVRPVVEAILLHPQLYDGPRMVKPPVVHMAGMFRQLRAAIDGTGWAWLSENAGQRLFYPPDVSGWDDSRWLDTSTLRGRWEMIASLLSGRELTNTQVNNYDIAETPEQAVALARSIWGDPNLTSETVIALTNFATAAVSGSLANWQKRTYRGLRQNALRQLIPFSPDYMTS